MLDDELMPAYYIPEELLRACLQNISQENYLYLENDLSNILNYPFSNPQLAILKEYLDEVIPAQKCPVSTDGIVQGLVLGNLGSPRV
ncbi:hypothetical protein EK904_009403 [Melospiza melodia maxima]|nr:hypothetical protein EK904_009403 [Melospiza melodia maxima]